MEHLEIAYDLVMIMIGLAALLVQRFARSHPQAQLRIELFLR